MALPYTELPEFLKALDQMERPLTVVAHQDDELTFSGVLSRSAPRMKIVWVTNGDGLYFKDNVSPEAYGKMRMAEAINSAAAVGIPEKQTDCLAYSEVDIYQRMMFVSNDQGAAVWVKPFFQQIIDDLRDRIFDYKPECLFTCAYQGGNPEHDLTHFFTRLVIDEYEKDSGKVVPFIHVPMYEYVILVALRFHPLYKGLRWRYELNNEEKTKKRAQFETYPSQASLLDDFQKVVKTVGLYGLLTRGRRFTPEEYIATEVFGPVPEDWDYLKSTHRFDWTNYIGDDFGNVPISFEKSVRPIVAQFPRKK
jgi:LmbE family N-acetylglucosaminyl deacetylase